MVKEPLSRSYLNRTKIRENVEKEFCLYKEKNEPAMPRFGELQVISVF